MIRGYVEQPSPRAGGTATLRVSTDAARFRVEVYRCGERAELVHRSGWLPGVDAPLHLPWHDFGTPGTGLRGEPLAPWPAYPLEIGRDWRPGVHFAVLVVAGSDRDAGGAEGARDDASPEDDASAQDDKGAEGDVRAQADDGVGHDQTLPVGDLYAPAGQALFVVRRAVDDDRVAPVLYKLPVLTYQAYNLAGGEPYDTSAHTGQWCFYNVPRAREVPVPFPGGLGLHRPGGGTGATPYDVFNTDPFDPTPRQTYVHWDAKFVAWLERRGYDVEYCTDVDLHREGTALLAPHRLLVSAGHDEYWSDAMRAGLEGFVSGGGNAAFFSGNTCWWRVRFHDDVTFERLHFWHDPEQPGDPENTMLGVSFRNGGERDRDDFPVPVGFRVQHAGHWVYQGTGLRDGDVFGERDYLVGYEADGADFDRADLDAGRPVGPTGDDGTPEDFTILAVGDTRPSGWGFGNGAATMGLFTRPGGGIVFTGSTTDWARVLEAGDDAVGRITANVVDRLSAPG